MSETGESYAASAALDPPKLESPRELALRWGDRDRVLLSRFHRGGAGGSIFPEAFEAMRRQLGIANRVLNILMPEVMLQRSRIDAVVGELVAAGMAQQLAAAKAERDQAVLELEEHDAVHLRAQTAEAELVAAREALGESFCVINGPRNVRSCVRLGYCHFRATQVAQAVHGAAGTA